MSQRKAEVNPTADGSSLCLACGLCCDGSLFMNAHLCRDEQEYAGKYSLETRPFEDNLVFLLPCPQFKGGCCNIYLDRPKACRNFQCKLLTLYLRGDVDLYTALASVHKARSILADLQQKMPFGQDTPVTFRNIHLMVAYLSASSEDDRQTHADFLAAATKYLRFVRRKFWVQKAYQPGKEVISDNITQSDLRQSSNISP